MSIRKFQSCDEIVENLLQRGVIENSELYIGWNLSWRYFWIKIRAEKRYAFIIYCMANSLNSCQPKISGEAKFSFHVFLTPF